MSQISIIEGDLLDQKADVITHQVNCLGVMGAGVALQIKNK
jgi:O-acetyl-ADP-ribose deacetylase (regulator of RNase III)